MHISRAVNSQLPTVTLKGTATLDLYTYGSRPQRSMLALCLWNVDVLSRCFLVLIANSDIVGMFFLSCRWSSRLSIARIG